MIFRQDQTYQSRLRHPVQRVWTIPNILSAYRIVVAPIIITTLIAGRAELFAWLIVINLLTDVLDGLLARLLQQETELGARLDSYADMGTYVLGMIGLIVFQPALRAHLLEMGLILVFYAIPQLYSMYRFGRPTSMHLYSSKISGIAQGGFFVITFLFGFSPLIFHAMLAISLVNNIEEIVVLVLLKTSRSNARGLYWLLRDRQLRGR